MSWSKMCKKGLGIFALVAGLAITAVAQNRTHTVKSGDTLFSIAQQYSVSVQDLKDWNELGANDLSVGQTLIVGLQSIGEPLVHTVQAQETLFSISKQYGVNISEIKAWNNLQGNDLQVGQKLTIHLKETGNDSQVQDNNNSIVVSTASENNTYYTVKSGDTLYQIAREHNMTVDDLKRLNDLNSNALSIGQRLTVKSISAPPSVTTSFTESSPQGKFVMYQIEKNQSLEELLNKFQMTKTEFTALNPGFTSSSLQKGQKVTLLAPPTRSYDNPYVTGNSLKSLGITGVSRYSASEKGKTTTSGELYNPAELTAAHSNIAMGTVMFIQNSHNNKGIYVRINDRVSGRGLKLSEAAWQALDFSSSNPTVSIYQD